MVIKGPTVNPHDALITANSESRYPIVTMETPYLASIIKYKLARGISVEKLKRNRKIKVMITKVRLSFEFVWWTSFLDEEICISSFSYASNFSRTEELSWSMFSILVPALVGLTSFTNTSNVAGKSNGF